MHHGDELRCEQAHAPPLTARRRGRPFVRFEQDAGTSEGAGRRGTGSGQVVQKGAIFVAKNDVVQLLAHGHPPGVDTAPKWQRPLTETTYPYLSVDARYEHVRHGGQIVSQGVLIFADVRVDEHREILAVAVADTESAATCHHLFADLKARSLSGVRLVTSDSHRD